MSNISAELILKTRPLQHKDGVELITLLLKLPNFCAAELNRHKRLSFNYVSNRAMGANRNLSLGYYTPDKWYLDQKGMQSKDDYLDEIDSVTADYIWQNVWEYCSHAMLELQQMGVAKEIYSRVLPSFKNMQCVVTGTKSAWLALLELRDNPSADKAMQELAKKIRVCVESDDVETSNSHLPYISQEEKEKLSEEEIMFLSAGRIARISYGKVESRNDDIALGKRLLESKHFSPFEHSAFWTLYPHPSSICSKGDDKKYLAFDWYGWENFRSRIE